MKSARERARELWEALPAGTQASLDLNYGRRMSANPDGVGAERWRRDAAAAFEEYAGDQRRICSERLSSYGFFATADEACTLMLDAPAPGEGQVG